jgi:hypothetical protein
LEFIISLSLAPVLGFIFVGHHFDVTRLWPIGVDIGVKPMESLPPFGHCPPTHFFVPTENCAPICPWHHFVNKQMP